MSTLAVTVIILSYKYIRIKMLSSGGRWNS